MIHNSPRDGVAAAEPPRQMLAFTEHAAPLFNLIFAPDDLILFRPIETWNEGDRKRSRVCYKQISYRKRSNLSPQWMYFQDRVLRAQRANLFYGVCPRFGGEGRFDQAWQIRVVRCLWSDMDGCSVDEALARIKAAELPDPSLIGSSGNGAHSYWVLEESFLIDDVGDPIPVEKEWVEIEGKKKPIAYVLDPETKEKRYLQDPQTGRRIAAHVPELSAKALHVQDVLKGIAAKIGGDHTSDLSRLLRVLGTPNRKDERNGREPLPSTLVSCSGEQYPFSLFEPFAAESPDAKERQAVEAFPLPTTRPLLAITKVDRLNRLVWECGNAAVGGRSDADFALCCYAIEQGVDKEEVRRLVAGTGKFKERGDGYFDQTWDKAALRTRRNLYEKQQQRSGNGDLETSTQGKKKNEKEKAEDVDPMVAARSFINAYHTDPEHGLRLRFHRDEFHTYNNRRYLTFHDPDLRAKLIEDLDGWVENIYKGFVTNIVECLKSLTLVDWNLERPCWLGSDREQPSYLAMENGLLDLNAAVAGEADCLHPHSPKWFSQVCIPYAYDPAADCPTWKVVLQQNLEGDEQRIRLFQEWCGYLLSGETKEQKFLILVGEGSNGKSVKCGLITALLGEENVSNVPLEAFGQRFQLNQTLGKLANIAAEVGELDKMAEGFIKAFTSGDRMTFERKHKDPFNAFPTARLVLATNNLPRFADRSGGVWRRMLLLPCNVKIAEDEKIKGLDQPQWWIASGELPGVLNWAIEGLRRLRKQGRFTESEVCQRALDEYQIECNPAKQFLTEFYQVHPDGEVRTHDTYINYRDWCFAHGYKPLADGTFGKEIRRAFPTAKQSKVRNIDGGRVNGYTGICRRQHHEF